jgi:hypothetical protein
MADVADQAANTWKVSVHAVAADYGMLYQMASRMHACRKVTRLALDLAGSLPFCPTISSHGHPCTNRHFVWMLYLVLMCMLLQTLVHVLAALALMGLGCLWLLMNLSAEFAHAKRDMRELPGRSPTTLTRVRQQSGGGASAGRVGCVLTAVHVSYSATAAP